MSQIINVVSSIRKVYISEYEEEPNHISVNPLHYLEMVCYAPDIHKVLGMEIHVRGDFENKITVGREESE